MPDERDVSKNDEKTLAVPGILLVSPADSGKGRIRVGPAAGWMAPKGITAWEREISFVPRAGLTPAVAAVLRATLPDEQVAPKRFPTVKKAVERSPLLALAGNLAQDARAQGLRVHTVGVDRVSGDFFYFEEGGPNEPLRVQGNLVEMLAPSLDGASTNADIAALLDGLLDRLLLSLSGGLVSELAVELVDALPRLSRDGSGLVGTDLEAFEAHASALASRSARWEASARRIPEALEAAAKKGLRTATVPLYGEAHQEVRPPLETLVGGKPLQLPAQTWWTVTGAPREETKARAEHRSPRAAAVAPGTTTADAKRSGPAERERAPVRATTAARTGSRDGQVDTKLSPPGPAVAPAPAAAPAPAPATAPAPAPAPATAPAPAPAPATAAMPLPPVSEPAPEAHAAAALTPTVANESGPAPVVLIPREEPAPAPVAAVAPRGPAKRSPVARIVALLLLAFLAYVAFWRMR
jgi:hypothetical protein